MRRLCVLSVASGFLYATPLYASDMGGIFWVLAVGFYAILWIIFGLIWLVVTSRMVKQTPTVLKASIVMAVPFVVLLVSLWPLLGRLPSQEMDNLIFLAPVALVALILACLSPVRMFLKIKKLKSDGSK